MGKGIKELVDEMNAEERKKKLATFIDQIPSIQKYRQSKAPDFETEFYHSLPDSDLVETIDSDLLSRKYGDNLLKTNVKDFDPFWYARTFDNSREGQLALNQFEKTMNKGQPQTYYGTLRDVGKSMSEKNSFNLSPQEIKNILKYMEGYY